MIKHSPYNTGWIEVICGSMFSGKTDELIRRITRAIIAKQKVVLFKPQIDNRFSSQHVVSHDQRKLKAIAVGHAKDILEKARSFEVVGIDEAQFFGKELVYVCQQLADEGKRVIVSGLDQDFAGNPFEPIPELLAIAEYITKNLAICVVCANPANKTQRVSGSHDLVAIGGSEHYQARCRRCHYIYSQDQDHQDQNLSGISVADA